MSDLNLPRIVNPNMDEVRYSGHGEDFRRLLTPEIVCNFRAAQVPFSRIPDGFILDPAAVQAGNWQHMARGLGWDVLVWNCPHKERFIVRTRLQGLGAATQLSLSAVMDLILKG